MRARQPRAYDANGVFRFCMCHNKEALLRRESYGNVTLFRLGMIRVVESSGHRIVEYRGCFVEGNAVFPQILLGFLGVPFEPH
jgi:hypothetical protein